MQRQNSDNAAAPASGLNDAPITGHPTPPCDEIVTDVEVIQPGEIRYGHSHVNKQDAQPTEAQVAGAPKISLMERLLSPRSINSMMSVGAALLVPGLAIWLWSVGVFNNPLVAATSAGAVNLLMLGCGLWLLLRSRFQLAGRGLTLLASIALPLNLWLYNAQGLITLTAGGHLWVPALVICAIYAATARLTRDPLFVWSLVGGIVMTGLLFLANPAIGTLWAILPATTFLLVVGLACVHADRLFDVAEGPFSRERFGKAFFYSGITVLASAVLVLAGGELFQRFDIFGEFTIFDGSAVETIWKLGLLAAATYGFAFAHLTRRRGRLYLLVITNLVIWISFTVVDLLAIKLTFDVLLTAIAIGVVTMNMWFKFGLKSFNLSDENRSIANVPAIRVPILISLGLILCSGIAKIALAVVSVQANAHLVPVYLLLAAIGSWTTDGFMRREGNSGALAFCSFAGASSLTAAIFSSLLLYGSLPVSTVAFISLVGPVLVVVAAGILARPHVSRRLSLGAGIATFLLFTSVLALMATSLIPFADWYSVLLVVSIAGILFQVAAANQQVEQLVASVGAACIAVVQIGAILQITNPSVWIGAVSAIGVGLVFAAVSGRHTSGSDTDTANAQSTIAGQHSANQSIVNRPAGILAGVHTIGNCLIGIAALGAILFTGSKIPFGAAGTGHVLLLLSQLLTLAIGHFVAREESVKTVFRTLGAITLATGTLLVFTLSAFTFVQRLELASLLFGAVLVIAGHIGLNFEGGEKKEWISASLGLGSIALIFPMIIGLFAYRAFGVETAGEFWRQLHEIGGITVGLALLASGILYRIRSTTLAGAGLLVSYVASVLFLVQWPDQLRSVSFLMMICGGTFFTVAILLSLYRDRLVALPEKIRKGEGIFKVVTWR